mmetsp:Transcript_12243/g.18334  ORF Transcript_12243/g.18334 Transcript_12243/m.18334 type:complete len:131 (+) Transcript_12243:108-500(+)
MNTAEIENVLTPKTVSALAKYKEMMISGAEESVVRLRMVNDGVSVDIIDKFLNQGKSFSTPQANVQLISCNLKKTPSFKKHILLSEFSKMIENGIPTPTVRQKMASQGMDPSEINAFFVKESSRSQKIHA